MPIDTKLLGGKLRRCRSNLDLEITDISGSTGIPTERIQMIETGVTEPSGDEILIFADYYKQDYKYFISNEKLSVSEQIEILYRKQGDEFSREDRWAIQEFIFLCESEHYVLEKLNFEVKNIVFPNYKKIFKNQGVDAAEKIRDFLNIRDDKSNYDLFSEFRKLGIHIFRRKLNNSNISGLFIKHPTAGKCILVNYEEDIYRQNFTIAHELCHALLDYDIDINVSYIKSNNITESKYREIRANAFAGSLLIPKKAILDLKINKWGKENILAISKKLKVNIQPILIALKEYGQITDIEYKDFISVKIPKHSKTDPELNNITEKIFIAKRILLEKGLSTFYVRNCYLAYEMGHISAGKLAEIFLVDLYELFFILELFNLKLEYDN